MARTQSRAEAVHKHFSESDETQKGHMKQQHQNVKSTKGKQNAMTIKKKKLIRTNQAKLKDMYIKIYLANDTVHFNQTGCFPATSSRGNKCIMVLVEIDGNYIDAELMKNKTEGSMIKAYLALWEHLTATGTVKSTTHIMDNEASTEYKKVLCKSCTIQLVPPNNHRCYLVERAIQTFKSHFIAIISGVDDTFPMRLWDKFLPQTIVTSTFSDNPMQFHQYPLTNTSEEHLITTKLHSDQWEVQYKCMKAEKTEAHGLNNRSTDGISEHHSNITNAKSFT
jgi:hypothetical protein